MYLAVVFLARSTNTPQLLQTRPQVPSRETILGRLLGGSEALRYQAEIPTSDDPVWLEPTPELLKRRQRWQRVWQQRWLWGSLLGVTAFAFTYYLQHQLHFRNDWLAAVLAAITFGLLIVSCLLDIRAKFRGYAITLAVHGDDLIVREPDGRQHRFPRQSLGFDGTRLLTPEHTIKLIRKASFTENVKFHCSRLPLHQRERFLRHLLPLLIDPAVLHSHPKGRGLVEIAWCWTSIALPLWTINLI